MVTPKPTWSTAARCPTWRGRAVPLPGVTGYRTRFSGDKHAGHRAGEGLPSSRRHYLNVPRPVRRSVLGGCDFRFFTASIGLHRGSSGSAPSDPTLTGGNGNDAAGFASCCGPSSCSPKRAFDTGLRPGPFPTRAASLLPVLLTATRTGLTPASDDEHEHQITPSRGHLLFHWAHKLSHSPRPTTPLAEAIDTPGERVLIARGQSLAWPSSRGLPRWA